MNTVGGHPAPLLERDHELEALAAVSAETLAGRGRIMVVRGEAGIGKTSLLGALAEHAERAGLTVARTDGTEARSPSAYHGARQLVSALQAALPAAAPTGSRATAALRAIGLQADGEEDARAMALGENARIVTFGLTELVLEIAATHPIALIVDDLHWVDEPTRRWLAFLTRRLRGAPVLLATAVRDGDRGARDDFVVAVADAADERLALEHLTPRATGALIARSLGREPEPAVVAECHHLAHGNPLLLEELAYQLMERDVAAGAGDVPGSHRQLDPFVNHAYERVVSADPTAGPVAEALAVLGAYARMDDLAALAGLDVDRVAAQVEALHAAGLVVADTYAFRHPILRTAVVEGMGMARRAELHELAAERLRHRGEPAGEVAAHVLATRPGRIPWARRVLADAAARDLASGAPETAIGWLRRALAESDEGTVDDAALEASLGQAYWQSNLVAKADEAFARSVARTTEPDLRLARATQRAIIIANAGGTGFAAALAALDQVFRDTAADVSPETAMSAAAGIVGLRLNADPGAIGAVPDPDQIPGNSRPERSMLAMLSWHAFVNRAPRERVVELARRGLNDGDIPLEPFLSPAAVTFAIFALLVAEDAPFIVDLIDQYEPSVREANGLHGAATLLAGRATWSAQRGDVATAITAAGDALELVGTHATMGWLALSALVEALLEAGRTEEARAALDDAGIDLDTAPTIFVGAVQRARGLLEEAEGDLETALVTFEAVGATHAAAGLWFHPQAPWRLDAGRVALALDRTPMAERWVGDHLEAARAWGAPAALARAEAAAAAVGLIPPRVRLPATLSSAQRSDALTDLGRARLAAGDTDRARADLRAALALLSADEHPPRVARIENELRRAGGRRRAADADPLGLTPAQRQVAQLAADGLSNREIAEELFITPKSVENQLRRVFRKLDITGRQQIADALVDDDDADDAEA